MATHSSVLAWRIPRMGEPGWLQSMGSRRVRHDWVTSLSLFTFHFHTLEKEMATYSSVLAWRIPGTGEPGGLPSMGSHRVGHDWSDLAAAAAAEKNLGLRTKPQRSLAFHTGEMRKNKCTPSLFLLFLFLLLLLLWKGTILFSSVSLHLNKTTCKSSFGYALKKWYMLFTTSK